MASLNGFKSYIAGATGSQGVLGPEASWKVYVLPRGAHASQASSGALITFDSASAASRFPTSYWVQVGTDTSKIRQVSAVGGDSINVGTAVSVAEGDRIFLIGTTQPTVTGGSASYQPHTTIYSRDDDGGTPITNSMLTTDSNGAFEFFAAPAFYDLLVQDSNRSLQTSLVDVSIGAFSGLTVSGTANIYDDLITGTSSQLRVYYDTNVASNGGPVVAAHFGARANEGGDSHILVYASENYTIDLSDETYDETVGVYGINQIRGNVAAGCDCTGVAGEVQYSPTSAKTATGPITGIHGTGRYGGTNPSAVCTTLRGGGARITTSVGSTGTVTSGRGWEVIQPSNQSTVAFGQYIGLYVKGCSTGFATGINAVAMFEAPSSEDSDVFFRNCPIRIDDPFNNGNAAAGGRVIDLYKTVVGGSLAQDSVTAAYAMHMQLGCSGTFTAGDDVYGYRSLVRTNTASGDGENLDKMVGYVADMDHRSNQLVDEVYGFQSNVTASGTSANPIVNTMAGLDVNLNATGVSVVNVYGAVLRSLTPAVGYSSAGHLRLVPVSTATPATTLATMTGAQDGTMVFITDSNHADNSGLYIRINSKWLCLVSGQSDFRIATDS